MKDNYPQFPLYIPSKGRHEYMVTSKALSKMGVRHYVIAEPQEVDAYRRASSGLLCDIVELDLSFKENYELCDSLGLSKSTGPGPARNFAWEHSKSLGFDWHWVMDDNLQYFARMTRNERIKTNSPAMWRAMEDFVLRYKNVGMAGPNYSMFAFGASKLPPFITNTRIYSCNLIRNDLIYRWRGRYNEDTILSLDMLKAGWCTIQFNAFLQGKMGTQVLKGGNTDEFYHAEGKVQQGQKYADTGTLAKSQMLVDVHPDLSRLVQKFSRWHHAVDYSVFKNQKLIKKDGLKLTGKPKDYGMKKVKLR
tara:strand:- start:952 stop:1869 length:918 start_codon:yes stop_codon:yes gene_type:complete